MKSFSQETIPELSNLNIRNVRVKQLGFPAQNEHAPFCIVTCRLPGSNIHKGKAVPLQAWSGPEGSRKLRLPDFLITAQDGGKVFSLTHRPHLTPGNTPGTHFC
jgi:hypothetical protein